MTKSFLLIGLLLMTLPSCSSIPRKPASTPPAPPVEEPEEEKDSYLWLEEVESEKALEWAKQRNEKALDALTSHPRYRELEPELRKILTAKDRIPMPALRGNWVYNFWQDEKHKKGILRRTSIEEYGKPEPSWEALLDIDALSLDEKESWVYKGGQCLAPEYERCLLFLSRGGKDAVVVREFDFRTKAFVPDGFQLEEAKSNLAWIDENTVLVGTSADSATASGYPRRLRIWKRGELFSKADVIFETKEHDLAVSGIAVHRAEGKTLLVTRQINFYEQELFLLTGKSLKKVPLPTSAQSQDVFHGSALVRLRDQWTTGTRTFSEGSLIAVPFSAVSQDDFSEKIELIYAPDSRFSLTGVAAGKNTLYLDVLENVKGRVLRATRSDNGKWELRKLPLPDHGTTGLVSSDPFQDRLFLSFESFLVPTSIYFFDSKPALLKQLPPRFNPSNLVVEQMNVASKDGEIIPYFVIRPKKARTASPAILYGYGGFEIALTPWYLGAAGKAWLEKGGVYVLANIRGGGEFGPRWHKAALQENRQKAFDDFIAIAEDLIRQGITSPEKLAIEGGSNGGLLVGAAMTQRPELFQAVLCEVPLLDMLRYHKLLAGHSWMAEYGDPDDPKMRPVIRAYSPYQNLRRDLTYPKAFFTTSTRDDRVHPAHARKMVARMEELGHEVLYFENIEGGHGNAADLEQGVRRAALKFTYFHERLMDIGYQSKRRNEKAPPRK